MSSMMNKVSGWQAVRFLRQVVFELSRVTWPSYQEFVGALSVVLILTCVFAVYMGAVDKVILRVMHAIFAYAGSS